MTLELSRNLFLWLKLFWNSDEILIYNLISDGFFLNEIFREIDPKANTNSLLFPKHNLVDKVKNWEILTKNIRKFYAEQLHQIILVRLPNVLTICRDLDSQKSKDEINKAIVLILVAAIQCDRKEYFLENIEKRIPDESVRLGLMTIVDQTMKDVEIILDFSNNSSLPLTDLIGHLRNAIERREDSFLEDNKTLLSEINDLRNSLSDQKNQNQNQMTGNVLSENLSDKNDDTKLPEYKVKWKYAHKELDTKSDIINDLRNELDIIRKENYILSEARENESLRVLQIQDELDCQRESLARIPIVELENRNLKENVKGLETSLENVLKQSVISSDGLEKVPQPLQSESEKLDGDLKEKEKTSDRPKNKFDKQKSLECDVRSDMEKSNSLSSDLPGKRLFSRSKSERRHSETMKNNSVDIDELKRKEENISALQRRISSMTFRDKELSSSLSEINEKYQLLEEKYELEFKLRNLMVKYFLEIITDSPCYQGTAEEINKLIVDNVPIGTDIQTIESHLQILKDKLVTLDNEVVKLKIRSDDLANQNIKLKVAKSTLRNQFDSLTNENNGLKDQISINDKHLSSSVGQRNDLNKAMSQLESQCNSLQKQNAKLSTDNDSLSIEFDNSKSQYAILKIDFERQSATIATLKSELERHTSLGIELERETANSSALKAELDRQITQSAALTLELNAMSREHEKVTTLYNSVKQRNEILEKTNISLAEDAARRVTNLRMESANINEEYNQLIEKYEEIESQLNDTIEDNRSLLSERQKDKEEIAKLKGINYRIVTKADEMEQEVGKLAIKIQSLIAYNDELASGHNSLLHQMKSMVMQNQELLVETLQSKQDHFTEENTLRNKINQLEWQKQYLDNKITGLNISNPSLTRNNSTNIKLYKTKESVKRKDSGTITEQVRTSFQEWDDVESDVVEVEKYEKNLNLTGRKPYNAMIINQIQNDSTMEEKHVGKSFSVNLGQLRPQYSPGSALNNSGYHYSLNKVSPRRSPKSFEFEGNQSLDYVDDAVETRTHRVENTWDKQNINVGPMTPKKEIDKIELQKGFTKSNSINLGHQTPQKNQLFTPKNTGNRTEVRSRSSSNAPEIESQVPSQTMSYHNSLYADPISKDYPITRLPVKRSIFPYRPELIVKKSSNGITDRVEEECGRTISKRNTSPGHRHDLHTKQFNPMTVVKSTNNNEICERSHKTTKETSPNVRPVSWTNPHSTNSPSNNKMSSRNNSEKSISSSAISKSRSKSPLKQS